MTEKADLWNREQFSPETVASLAEAFAAEVVWLKEPEFTNRVVQLVARLQTARFDAGLFAFRLALAVRRHIYASDDAPAGVMPATPNLREVWSRLTDQGEIIESRLFHLIRDDLADQLGDGEI